MVASSLLTTSSSYRLPDIESLNPRPHYPQSHKYKAIVHAVATFKVILVDPGTVKTTGFVLYMEDSSPEVTGFLYLEVLITEVPLYEPFTVIRYNINIQQVFLPKSQTNMQNTVFGGMRAAQKINKGYAVLFLL